MVPRLCRSFFGELIMRTEAWAKRYHGSTLGKSVPHWLPLVLIIVMLLLLAVILATISAATSAHCRVSS